MLVPRKVTNHQVLKNEGTFSVYQMKTQQWNSLVDLCVSICSSCKIDPDNIKGHRDFIETQCPGDWLYSQLPRLRSESTSTSGHFHRRLSQRRSFRPESNTITGTSKSQRF